MAGVAAASSAPREPTLDAYLIWQLLLGRLREAENNGWLVHVVVEFSEPDYLYQTNLLPSHVNAQRGGFKVMAGLLSPEDFFKLFKLTYDQPDEVLRLEFSGVVDAATIKWPPLRSAVAAPLLAVRDLVRATKAPGSGQGSGTRGAPPVLGSTCSGMPPLVAVIDDRCSLSSAALHPAGAFPVATVWHQGGGPVAVTKLGEKRWSEALVVGSGVSAGTAGGGLIGRRTTIGPTPLTPGSGTNESPFGFPPPTFTHGAAVMHLIAAQRQWVARRDTAHRWTGPQPASRPVAPVGVHFVQLPVPEVVDTLGRNLAASVLDAVHDAVSLAQPGRPVIVNLSFGTHGGPHDGSSLVEAGLKELLDHYDGRKDASRPTLHLVLPAGNSHLWRCHATACLSVHRPEHTLRWRVLPDDPTDNFVEIWVPLDARVTVTLKRSDLAPFSIDVVPGDTAFKPITQSGNPNPIGAVISAAIPTQSSNGRLILVCLAATGLPAGVEDIFTKILKRLDSAGGPPPTRKSLPAEEWLQIVKAMNRDSGGREKTNGDGSKEAIRSFWRSQASAVALAPHGIYEIKVSRKPGTVGPRDVRMHAWIQRGDTAPMRDRSARGYQGRQSYFLDTREDGAGVEPRFSLNGIATFTHKRLFVAGAMRFSDDGLSNYTASGPNRGVATRVEGPDWVVHADESRNQPGLLVSGARGGAWQRVSGTSMAAAVLTRHLYEHLCHGGTAESFQFRPQYDEEYRERVSAEAPAHAHPVHRGLWRRVIPAKDDGSV